jgi:glutathione S-transferase
MLVVHHLGVSQSERIVWLCEELGLAYELKVYQRDAVTRMAPPAYRALHPLGTAPIITDGEVVLPESGAIMQYILGRYGAGRLAPGPEQENFADYLFWFHFANASLMSNMMTSMVVGADAARNPMMSFVNDRREKAYALMERRLGEVPYFAGAEFTAADIIMLFPLTTMRAFTGAELAAYPNILAYLKRIGERPAYQRAMAKGDPGMAPLLD